MNNEMFKIKNIKKVKGKKYYIISLVSIVLGSVIPTTIAAAVISHFNINHYYHWGFSFVWGALYGWLEPTRKYYDLKYDNLRKKFRDHSFILSKLSSKGHGIYYNSPFILCELLTYNRIKPDDIFAVDSHYRYVDRDYDYYDDQLSNAIIETGINPRLLLKSNIYPKSEYVVFFENYEDFNLMKLALGNDTSVLFLHGKELLDYINGN